MTPSPDPDSTADRYRDRVLGEVPRILSLLDREPASPTRGCFDRTYWAWKFVDFPGSRFQEGLCALSFAWDDAESPYHGDESLRGWIEAGFDYWCGLQHSDGSFDEAYPLERSLAATAFTGFYVAEAFRAMEPALDPDVAGRARRALEAAGRWLLVNDESHGMLSNHIAAAAAALEHVHLLTDDPAFSNRARAFVQRILDRQSAEGWYEEYGGADPGYQTHGSFYLARYLELTDHPELETSLERATGFLAHFVHPDGSLGGEYASRNTKTYYPAAFEMLAERSPAAAWIAEHMRGGLEAAESACLTQVDAYNYFPFVNNYVFALKACRARSPAEPAEDPTPATGLSHFPEAGLLRIRRPRYEAFVGTAKGGVVKVFDRDARELALSDSGYVGTLTNGRRITSQYEDPARPVDVSDGAVVVRGGFVEFSRPTMTPVRFLGFRAFSLTLGRVPSVGRWLKRLLVRVLIYRRSDVAIDFERRIEFDDHAVSVIDRLESRGRLGLRRLEWAPIFTSIHMGSARYFVANELRGPAGGFEVSVDELERGLGLERSVAFDVAPGVSAGPGDRSLGAPAADQPQTAER